MIDLNKIRVHNTLSVRIKKSVPTLAKVFESRQRIAIYFETSYHEQINRYIRSHYEDIYNRLYSNGIVFIYIPVFLENLDEYIEYNFPNNTVPKDDSLTAERFYNEITKNLSDAPSTGRPMLLITEYRHGKRELPDEDHVQLRGYDLDYADDNQFRYALNHYLPAFRLSHEDILFRDRDDIGMACEESVLYGYDADNTSITIIGKEIRDRVNQLVAMGVNWSIIKTFFTPDDPRTSKLLITEDFRILLPDYKNREIKIPALAKSLYFLYLRYTNGIRFKEQCDYRNELLDLYCIISCREKQERMQYSINNLVDCTSNSVNEQCCRIKTAFVSQINDDLARQYYIDGPAGKPRRIILDRSLVEDQSGMIIRT